MKPVVFITAGDPLGIGPEVTVKALKNTLVKRSCSPVVIGEPDSLFRAGFNEKLARLIPLDSCACLQDAVPGPTLVGGLSSFKAVELGCKLAKKTKCALVTAPISKQSWALAGIPYTGHTEFLREQAGKNGLMMFVSGKLRCAVVTEHFSLAEVPRLLTKKRIMDSAKHLIGAMERGGVPHAHIAIAALNPHASDNGQFGTEENAVIAPAVRMLQRRGLQVDGPFPIDSLWLQHAQGMYDGILCMYHDQALLGLKLAAKEPIVHITAGLKFVRMSPTHGTAFDIAGKNKANESSMVAAILLAAKHGKCPDIFATKTPRP